MADLRKQADMANPKPECSIADCPKPATAPRGWCWGHYERWRKHGDPLAGRPRWDGDHSARFWAKVDKNGPAPEGKPELGPCWLWTGAIKENGYGNFGVTQGGKTRNYYPHRWAYTELVGPIADGLDVDHLCRVRSCCNPAHLEPVTRQVNIQRSIPYRAPVTHCPAGHEYTPENTRIVNGSRICRACVRQRGWDRAKNPGTGMGGHNKIKTHCPQGHPYDEENTRYPKRGGRVCRICEREAQARYQERKRLGDAA